MKRSPHTTPARRLMWVLYSLPLALLVAGFAIMTAPALAQPLKLDWDAAWKLVCEQSEDMEAALDQYAKAQSQIGEAYSNAMPTVTASGAFQHYFEIPMSIKTLPGDTVGAPHDVRMKIAQGSENTAIGSVELNQPLYVGGKVGIAIKLAKIYREISELGLDVTSSELKKKLTEAFYGAILAAEYQKVSAQAMEQAERHLQQVQNLFDQGMVSEYDLIRAKVAVAELRPQIIEAETAVDLSLRGLKLLLRLDIDQEIEIVGSLDQAVAQLPAYEFSTGDALKNRGELKQLGLTAQLYEGQQLVEEHSTLWPNLFLSFKYQTMAAAEDFKLGKYEFLDGFSGTLALSIPLFDGFASKNRAEQAHINKRATLRQQKNLEDYVKLQVFQALQNFKKAQEQMNAARESVAQTEKGVAIADVRYKEGVGTQLEWLDAELQLNSSRVKALQAQYDLLTAQAAYERAMGRF